MIRIYLSFGKNEAAQRTVIPEEIMIDKTRNYE
jgi:hypothetical protein